eukprot:SAG22_NODE_9106_length_609_cov_4.062745_1_plen_138_part_10
MHRSRCAGLEAQQRSQLTRRPRVPCPVSARLGPPARPHSPAHHHHHHHQGLIETHGQLGNAVAAAALGAALRHSEACGQWGALLKVEATVTHTHVALRSGPPTADELALAGRLDTFAGLAPLSTDHPAAGASEPAAEA